MSLLTIRGLCKSFLGVQALNEVNLSVAQGEVHAVIGPNGAGKTTLFNCISGLYRGEHGSIIFKDQDISRTPAYKIAALGIARTFQNLELFRNATVLDNIILGRYLHKRTGLLSEAFFLPRVRRQELADRRKVEEIIEFLDLEAHRERLVSKLPFGIQKTVELARTLALEPELILLDEPSSGLNPEETQELCYWIEDIKESFKITIVLVEHDMRVVSEVSDQVTALDFGVVIAHGNPTEVQRHPDVIKAYLGEEDGDVPAALGA